MHVDVDMKLLARVYAGILDNSDVGEEEYYTKKSYFITFNFIVFSCDLKFWYSDVDASYLSVLMTKEALSISLLGNWYALVR